MRFALCLMATLVGSAARASFDLIMVTDLSKDCVHRYDGDTGTYLGSFGQNFLETPRAISLDATNNMVLVEHNLGTSAFNYNTGQHLYTNPAFTGASESVLSAGSYYRSFSLASSSAFGRVSNPQNSSGQVVHLSSVIGPFSGIANDVNGKIFVAESNNGRVMRWTPGVTGIEEAISGNTLIRSGLGSNGTQILGLGLNGEMVSVNALTMVTLTGGAPQGAAWTSALDCAAGHAGSAWGLGTTASGTIIQSYARHPGSLVYRGLNRFNATQVTTPGSIAVVLAPEPGTMAALLVGGIALLRRRKPSKT